MKFINNNPKRPYICPELKDKLLNILIDNSVINKRSFINSTPLQKEMGDIDSDIIIGMLDLFDEDGLIEMFGYNRITVDLILKGKSIEFARLGGYSAKEELIKKQLTLLNEQIKDLQSKNVIDKTDSIFNTVGNITSLIFKLFN